MLKYLEQYFQNSRTSSTDKYLVSELRVFDLLMIQTDISISSNKGVKKDTNATSKVV